MGRPGQRPDQIRTSDRGARSIPAFPFSNEIPIQEVTVRRSRRGPAPAPVTEPRGSRAAAHRTADQGGPENRPTGTTGAVEGL
ncbi:hypothetical protein GCM10009528_05950 [Kineococcus aurantiacus]